MNRQRYSLPPVGPTNPPKDELSKQQHGHLSQVFPVAEQPEDYLYKRAVERAFAPKQPEPDPLFEMLWK